MAVAEYPLAREKSSKRERAQNISTSPWLFKVVLELHGHGMSIWWIEVDDKHSFELPWASLAPPSREVQDRVSWTPIAQNYQTHWLSPFARPITALVPFLRTLRSIIRRHERPPARCSGARVWIRAGPGDASRSVLDGLHMDGSSAALRSSTSSS